MKANMNKDFGKKEFGRRELSMEELEQVNAGVMVEAYEVLATGVAKVTQLIYRLFN